MKSRLKGEKLAAFLNSVEKIIKLGLDMTLITKMEKAFGIYKIDLNR
jgi:hypothetical protein